MAKRCSELAATLMDIARWHVENGASTIDEVVGAMQGTIPALDRNRLVSSIVEVMDATQFSVSDFEKRLTRLKREARRDKELTSAIDELEAHLAEATLPAAKAPRKVNRTEAIQKLTDKKNALIKALNKSDPALIERYKKQIESAYEKLADVKFIVPKVERKEFAENAEVESLRFERDKVRRKVRTKIDSLRPKTVWDTSVDWANSFKALMSSGEFSGVLRQGKFAVFADPKAGGRAVLDMFRSFASEEFSERANAAFHADRDVQKLMRAGLQITDIDGELAQQEEAIMSRWANKIPAFKNFNRAYNTFLNSLRVYGAKGLMQYTVDADPTFQEMTDIARAVNTFTGRGSLGPFEQSAAALNAGLFSPRYQMSRLQILTGQPVWAASSPNIRKAILARFYGRSLIGMASQYLLYGLLFGDDEKFSLSTNPLSSDFGKLTVGKVKIDPMAGLLQPIVFLNRAATGSRVTGRGEKVAIGEEFGEPDLVANFLRSKTAPAPGAVWDLIRRRDILGNKTTLGGTLFGLTTPMAYEDIYKVLTQEQGVGKKTAIALLTLFGEGVSVYEQKPRSQQTEFSGFK